MPGDFDTVKERVDIVQVIGERVSLKKAGRAYKGLCPFHSEKTPSFTVDPDRRTYKCFGCLPPGSLVKTSRGPLPIETIGVGDAVYASDGVLHAVVETHEHLFRGSLVELTCAPFKIPVLLTPDHEVPVLRPRSRRLERVPAGRIRPQNYLLYPGITRPSRPLDWSTLPTWFGARGKTPKTLPAEVDVLIFAEWLGWYLAEGSVSNDRTVRFSLGSHETGPAERIRDLTEVLFAERPRGEPAGSRLELWFCHALLSRWLKHHCGVGALNKHLPDFVWSWTPTQQRSLFTALLAGDGRLNQGPVRAYGYFANPSSTLTSASVRLIDDIRDLLIVNGVIPSLKEETKQDGRKAWRLTVSSDDQEGWGSGERPETEPVAVRVRKVRRTEYDGPVYNLTVAEDHTYVTMSGTVFNCGEGGDVFTWLEKQDGLSPAEALKVLAERAGVELTTRRDPAEQEREKRLLAANDTAHFYFRQALRGTDRGKEVARYLADRGIQPATADKFGLGYAPDRWDGLVGYLRKKGYSDEEVVAAGLVGRSDRGVFDWFRDRLIVPIKDGRGRIIAFGGRAMRAEQRGKYVNSQGTVLFNKSATLYALDAARTAIRKQNAAVIVEGYFDAIALHQAGFENTVASMGTALTEDQYHVLDAMRIERAVVAFDGDAAGQNSAERRGIDLAQQVQRAVRRAGRGSVTARTGLSVYVTVLPTDTDPDVLARRDPERLRTLLGEAKPVLEFVLDRISARSDLGQADGRRRFLAEAVPLVGGEPDPLTREVYLGTLSKLTGVEQEALRREAAAAPREPGGRGAQGEGSLARSASERDETPAKQTAPAERYLMALLIRFPEEAARTDLASGDLDDPDHRAMFEWLRAGKHPTSDLPAHLAAKAAALGASAPELEGEVDVAQAIEIAALALRERNLRRRMKDAQGQLARGDGGDAGVVDGEVARLADELAELMHRRERHTVLHTADADERDE